MEGLLFLVDLVLCLLCLALLIFSGVYVADKGESKVAKVAFWVTWALSTVLAVVKVVLEVLFLIQAIDSGAINRIGFDTTRGPLSLLSLLLICFTPFVVRCIAESIRK